VNFLLRKRRLSQDLSQECLTCHGSSPQIPRGPVYGTAKSFRTEESSFTSHRFGKLRRADVTSRCRIMEQHVVVSETSPVSGSPARPPLAEPSADALSRPQLQMSMT